MKITKVEIMATNTPFLGTEGNTGEIAQGKWELCRFVVVKVHTDEGIVGYGESAPFARLSPLGQKPIIDVLVDYVAPAVIGLDPFNTETIWMAMDRATPDNAQAKGAIDMALYKALRDTVIVNGATTFMVGLSSAFAAYLSLTGIPRTLAAAMLGITDNKILLFVLINLFLLIVGCLVDNIPATIILAPILLPVVTALGMSPVTFGIMLTMNLAIGFCTPPYGIDLFVASAISGVSIGKMMKYMIWFLFALLVVLMLVTYWPEFTLFAFA